MSEVIQETYAGLMVEWLYNRKIVIFTVTSMAPDVVELWANKVIEITEARHARDIFYIHDASKVQFSMTPHFRRQSERIVDAHPDAEGFVAIILRESLLLKVTRMIIENLVSRSQPKISSKIYFDRVVALAWLTECMSQSGQPI